jgi:hypothetical protein
VPIRTPFSPKATKGAADGRERRGPGDRGVERIRELPVHAWRQIAPDPAWTSASNQGGGSAVGLATESRGGYGTTFPSTSLSSQRRERSLGSMGRPGDEQDRTQFGQSAEQCLPDGQGFRACGKSAGVPCEIAKHDDSVGVRPAQLTSRGWSPRGEMQPDRRGTHTEASDFIYFYWSSSLPRHKHVSHAATSSPFFEAF